MKSETINHPDFARRSLWRILRGVLGFFGTCLFMLIVVNAFCCDSLPNAVARAFKSLQVQQARLAEAARTETEHKKDN